MEQNNINPPQPIPPPPTTTMPDQLAQPKNNFIVTIIIIFILGLAIGGGAVYMNMNKRQVDRPMRVRNEPTGILLSIPPPISVPQVRPDRKSTLMGRNTIAYMKEGQIYLKSASEEKKLTNDKHVGDIRWSQDGRYIGFIEQQKIYPPTPSLIPTDAPPLTSEPFDISTSVYIIDTKSGAISLAVPSKYTGGKLIKEYYQNSHATTIEGFDFYPQDSSKIVFTRDGLWVHDLAKNTDEQLLQNDPQDKILSGQGGSAIGVESHPKLKKLLVRFGYWENIGYAIYDISTKQKIGIEGLSCNTSKWSNDGNKIISYNQMGFCDGGIWITPLDSLKKQTILARKNDQDPGNASVLGTTEMSSSQFLAITVPWTNNGPQDELRAIYTVDYNGQTQLMKAVPHGSLIESSPDRKTVAYLSNCNINTQINKEECDLHIMSADGINDTVLDKKVTTFVWKMD